MAIEHLVFTELKLPWRWLVLDVYAGFVAYIGARLDPTSALTIDAVFLIPNPPAPAVSYTFETLPGETVSAALQRLGREFWQIRARLLSPLPLRPQRGKDPADVVREAYTRVAKYGRWFHQYRVLGESIRRIGKAYHTEQKHEHDYGSKGCDCRKNVHYGIQQAKRLLNLVE